MNRDWVIDNLRETVEHIESVIRSVEAGNDDAFEAWVEFIYRDLNRAWNGRTLDSPGAAPDEMLRQFPPDVTFED